MPVRERSESAVLDALRLHPEGRTRTELVEETKLSRPTIVAVVSELEDRGLVHQLDEERVALTPASGLFVGLDLGHGHVAAAIGTGGADILAQPKSSGPVDVDGLGIGALEPAMNLVADLLTGAGLSARDVKGIGVGVPAPLLPEGMVASSKYLPSFLGAQIPTEVLRAFQQRFGDRLTPVVTCENDANLGVLGETALGVAQGTRDAIYVKASTGIGAGILLEGQPWVGSHQLAGELGHVGITTPAGARWLPLDTTPCPRCDRPLCLEKTTSASALIAQLHREEPETYSADLDFDQLVDEIIGGAANHRLARRALLEAGQRLGVALADITRILDPETVVLGGKLARAGALVGQPFREAIAKARIGDAGPEVVLVGPDEVPFSEARGGVILAVREASARRL
jgi:predicted NBD/HSP70 family sugar kinase